MKRNGSIAPPTNETRIAALREALAELLVESLRRDFSGVVGVRVEVEDGQMGRITTVVRREC